MQSEMLANHITEEAEQALHVIGSGGSWMFWFWELESTPFPAFNVGIQSNDYLSCESKNTRSEQ